MKRLQKITASSNTSSESIEVPCSVAVTEDPDGNYTVTLRVAKFKPVVTRMREADDSYNIAGDLLYSLYIEDTYSEYNNTLSKVAHLIDVNFPE